MELLNHPDLAKIVLAICLFGGGALFLIVMTLADAWQKVRVAEQNAILKKLMLDRGFTAEEIIAVMNANGGGKAKMPEKQSSDPARSCA